MRITGALLPAAPPPIAQTRTVAMSRPESPAVSVGRSEFSQQLREAARTSPGGTVRADVVAEARADIAAGRLGSPADIERAIDALLREL